MEKNNTTKFNNSNSNDQHAYNGYERFNSSNEWIRFEKNNDEIENIMSIKSIKKPGVKYAVEMLSIFKSFNNGKVIANDNIDLRIARNEIHALIGENGAGKSTLMSILFGLYEPNSGDIIINGKKKIFSSANDANKAGLGMVHQHFKLVQNNTVFENIILGSESITEDYWFFPLYFGAIDKEKSRKKINAIIRKYNLNLNIDSKISNLRVGEQQKVEILKLLYKNARILIFDEPTSVLSPIEIDQFLEIIKNLKREGRTIVIITHKFSEIKSVAERATVIRHGRYISDFDVKDKTMEEMAELMVGKKIENIVNYNHEFSSTKVLTVKQLDLANQLNKNFVNKKLINFNVHAGEIFAIAGVGGNGQSELATILSGLTKTKTGSIQLLTKDAISKKMSFVDITNKSILSRYRSGMSFVPEDRQKHGLIMDIPSYYNAVINKIGDKPFSNYGFINVNSIKNFAKYLIKKYDVRGTYSGDTPSRSLSGGNQQKLIIGRELTSDNNLIILVQPTRGLDLGAVEYIHSIILEEKKKGKAILLISYELDEILKLADTIAVIDRGVFVDVKNTSEITRKQIGELMLISSRETKNIAREK